MAQRSKYGFVNRNSPEAAGVCDRGGEVRKLSELHREMIWAGNRLVWNGMLCCRWHIDRPQPQDRVLILPPDPVPVPFPRPMLGVASPGPTPTPGDLLITETGDVLTTESGDGLAY